MIIQKYDMIVLKLDSFSNFDISSITNSVDNLYYIRMFFIYFFGYIRRNGVFDFIEKLKTIYKNGMEFEFVYITIDNKNEQVYFSEGYYDYRKRKTTEKIEKLLEEENFIELCKIGFLDYIIMTKDNFIHLLLTWDKILDQLPPFALLYQDDKNWFEVLPFDSQEAMEQFIANHSKSEKIE